jgi:hypothetical protein
LRVALELISTLLRAEIVVFAAMIQLGSGVLFVNLHVANRVSVHNVLRIVLNELGFARLPCKLLTGNV